MTDHVQLIKDRLDIIEVVSQYVTLTKAGKNYKGLSPFRKEKTPSFFVSPDKGMYYDFSSSQGGDMFSFIQKMEGVDFKGALQILAQKAGVEIIPEKKDVHNTRERMYTVLEESTSFFEKKLLQQPDANNYLRERGLEEHTIKNFRLGFAPYAWVELFEHLRQKGFKDAEIENAGMIKKGERGKYYDRFRSRIMFPIANQNGRIVAFSGRIFGEPAIDPKNAKYINSPETELFNKSNILYGYNIAKQFIRRYDFSILVEGQMDIVMSHQSGYGNTVAVSGTGLTNEHLNLLSRISKKIVMAFDADSAGIASNGRAAILALQKGMDVKVAKIPLGKDPADCIQANPLEWKHAIRDAQHVVDFFTDVVLTRAKEKEWTSRQTLLFAREMVLPYITFIVSPTDQAHFVRNYANIFNITEESVWGELHIIEKTQPHEEKNSHLKDTSTKKFNKKTFSRKNDLEQSLAGFLFWHDAQTEKKLGDSYVQKKADEYMISLPALLSRHYEQRETLMFQFELTFAEHIHKPEELFRTLMKDLAIIYTSEELESIAQKLRTAEREGNYTEKEKLDLRTYELSKFKRDL